MAASFVSEDFVGTMDAKKATGEFNYMSQQANEFYIRARRNRLLSEWAVHVMKWPPERVDAYLTEIIDADFLDGMRNETLVAKVENDFTRSSVTSFGKPEILEAMRKFENQARLERTKGHPLSGEPREA